MVDLSCFVLSCFVYLESKYGRAYVNSRKTAQKLNNDSKVAPIHLVNVLFRMKILNFKWLLQAKNLISLLQKPSLLNREDKPTVQK